MEGNTLPLLTSSFRSSSFRPGGALLLAGLALGAGGCADRDGDAAAPPPRFTEIAHDIGLRFVHDAGVDSTWWMPESIGAGGALLDYDGDGDLDVYLVNGGRRGPGAGAVARDRLFRQEPDGHFRDVTEESGAGDTAYGMGVAVGDIDNDGDLDLYVTNVGPDALYRNEGDGTFTGATAAAGIADSAWGASATFVDYDRDGWLDLYVTNYVALDPAVTCTDQAGRPDYCGPQAHPGVSDRLYRNEGDGRFRDASAVSGIAEGRGRGLGVTALDYDRDGWPDLYVANDGEPNHLWRNRGDGTFEDVAARLGVAVNALGRPEAGMGIAVGDVDGDLTLDLLVTHLGGETHTLYRRRGAGWLDDTSPAGLHAPTLPWTGFGTAFLDFDHDGDLDVTVANGRVTRGPLRVRRDPPGWFDPYAEPNQLLENDGRGGFVDVSGRETVFSGLIENSRGLATGDVDGDGDLDVLITNGGGPARLLRNDGAGGRWLLVRAVDPALRRDALGAEVVVEAGGRRWLRPISAGHSFLSSSDPRAHFGLGSAATVDRIVVRWPDGRAEAFPGGPADRALTLRRGEGAPVPFPADPLATAPR